MLKLVKVRLLLGSTPIDIYKVVVATFLENAFRLSIFILSVCNKHWRFKKLSYYHEVSSKLNDSSINKLKFSNITQ